MNTNCIDNIFIPFISVPIKKSAVFTHMKTNAVQLTAFLGSLRRLVKI